MTNIDNPFGERAQQNSRITRVTSVTVILFITLVACKLGQAVLEPVVFAVFIIAIASPLQKSMQARVGKAIALSVTVVMTAAVILALFALIAWGGREVVEWVRQNLDRIQETMTTYRTSRSMRQAIWPLRSNSIKEWSELSQRGVRCFG